MPFGHLKKEDYIKWVMEDATKVAAGQKRKIVKD